MSSFNKVMVVLLSLFCIVNFSCRRKNKIAEKVIVEKPADMDAEVSETIHEMLKFATDNNGKFNDSAKLLLLPVVQAYYNANDYKNIWSTKEKWNPAADSIYDFIKRAELYGLYPVDYHIKNLDKIRNILERDSVARTDAIVWSKADLLLTDAFMEMLQDLKQGRLVPDSVLISRNDKFITDFFIKNLNDALQTKSISAILDSVEPKHTGYHELRNALPQFLDSMNRTVYTYVVYPTKDSLSLIKTLKTRLREGEYIEDQNAVLDSVQLAGVIKKVQRRKNINPDGKLSASFIKMLNNTDVEKFKRIAITLDRYKLLPSALPEKYIWVNLPGYYLRVMEDDSSVLWSKVIIGKTATRTPLFNSFITDMITYPQWTIPSSIIKKEILPALKKDPGYLSRKGFSLFDMHDEEVDPYTIKWAKYTKGIPYKVRQGSGDDNALGILKFNFYNKYNIYLHDTNQRYLFSKSMRALSHGCVRVQQWDSLAFYIARNDSINVKPPDSLRYNTDSIKVWLANKERKRIVVKNKLPLFIQYYTCEARKGKLVFYDDIYNEDRFLRDKYFAAN